MTAVESLAQTPSGQRQLRLMAALSELPPVDDMHQVELAPLVENPASWSLDAATLTGDLATLQEWGWIEYWETYSDLESVMVKQPGIDAADDFKRLQNDPVRRAREARDAVLRWLYERYVTGQGFPGMQDFSSSKYGNYLGVPYTEAEVTRACGWLRQEGYMGGPSAWGGAILRPTITSQGIRIIETEQSVNAILTQAGVTVNEINVSNSNGVNVALASSNVNQSNTLTQGQIDQVEQILGSVRALLNPAVLGVSKEVAAEAEVVAGELEKEVQSDSPKTGVVKGALIKLAELAATGTVQGAIAALNAIIQHAITSM